MNFANQSPSASSRDAMKRDVLCQDYFQCYCRVGYPATPRITFDGFVHSRSGVMIQKPLGKQQIDGGVDQVNEGGQILAVVGVQISPDFDGGKRTLAPDRRQISRALLAPASDHGADRHQFRCGFDQRAHVALQECAGTGAPGRDIRRPNVVAEAG
ncbi:hypothetical protein [Streptomyces sp. NPDC093544]|uniref:hypothetical protein n=1 Tax=Streptomyces sp. NPDC093544 TaxID=3155200 RepID=UPI00343C4859